MATHVLVFLAVLIGFASAQNPPYRYVHCQLLSNADAPGGENQVGGTIDFRQKWFGGPTDVVFNVTGFDPADEVIEHGYHIHEYGDFTDFCGASMGPHYNPDMTYHGPRTYPLTDRHVGDLGNLREDSNGQSMGRFTLDQFPDFHGDYSIIGRAIIVKQFPDDLGEGGNEFSLRTGTTFVPGLTCCALARANGGNGAFFD